MTFDEIRHLTLPQATLLREEWIYHHPTSLLIDFIARILPKSKGGTIPARQKLKRREAATTRVHYTFADDGSIIKGAPKEKTGKTLNPAFEEAIEKMGYKLLK